MSDQPEILLIDIGNTRLKVMSFNDAHPQQDVLSFDSVESLLPLVEASERVLVSCVGARQKLAQLETICTNLQKSLFVAKTEAQRFGVRCAYQNFSTMGVDRWLAILAARSLTSLPVAVMDFGTAATCDVVVEGEHVGGWIVPGFAMMKHALTTNTAQVFANSEQPEHLVFADSTEGCVNMGCLAAIQGIFFSAEKLLSQYADDYRMIITGGDKHLLRELRGPHVRFEENMVLKGLRLFV